MMKVHIQFFALCREKAGCEKTTLDCHSDATLEDVKTEVTRAFPPLDDFSASLLFAVNGNYVKDSHILKEGDTIACFPPVSGG